MGDYLRELSPTERETLEELKKRLDNDIDPSMKNDDILYLRFLRARDFQIDLAEDMLRKHLDWRKMMQIDFILTQYKLNEITKKYFPMSRMGFDKDGSPIRYIDFGKMDLKGLMKAVKTNEIFKLILSYFEEDVKVMQEQNEKLQPGKPIYQWIYVLNFDGYTFSKATHKPSVEFLMNVFSVYEANYPERLKKSFVINTSTYFTIMYSVIKPFLSPATVKKISIYGKDGWKRDLLNQIDADVLPKFLGGQRTDPDGDPMCRTILLHGEQVPQDLYMTRGVNRLSTRPDARKLVVSRRSKAFFPLEVKQAGSMIEWEFETETRDISFGLCFKEGSDKSESEDLIPKQRIDAHLVSETGVYKCEKSGIYILVFDNSYSWIHRKEIYCRASIVLPSGQTELC